jgi:hypothetical protein
MPEEMPDDRLVFTRPDNAGNLAVVWLLAGLGASGIAVLGFLVSLLKKTNAFELHFASTLPAVGAVAAFTRARSIASTPREVVVDPEGLSILWHQMRQDFPWEQIGGSKIAKLAMNGHRRLVLLDPRGKTLAKIDEGIGNFDRLKEYVEKKLEARGGPTAGKIAASKKRRSAVLIGSVFGVMLLLNGLLAVMTRYEQQEARALEERGVKADATIVRRFLAFDRTPRLEYRVDTPDGRSGTRDTAMLRRSWDALASRKTVPALYDPDNPANSRLFEGEDREGSVADNATSTYWLCVGVSVICLGGLAFAFFRWKGWTVAMGPNGMPSIVPSRDAG